MADALIVKGLQGIGHFHDQESCFERVQATPFQQFRERCGGGRLGNQVPALGTGAHRVQIQNRRMSDNHAGRRGPGGRGSEIEPHQYRAIQGLLPPLADQAALRFVQRARQVDVGKIDGAGVPGLGAVWCRCLTAHGK